MDRWNIFINKKKLTKKKLDLNVKQMIKQRNQEDIDNDYDY